MQVQGVRNINFTSAKVTPEMLEKRAMALENGEVNDVISTERVYNMIDNRLKKTKIGRKIINFVVSAAGFSAAVISFKKVAPKLRHGIAAATGRVAGKFGKMAKQVNNKNINQLADEVAQESSKLAAKGDGSLLKNVAIKALGDKNGTRVLNGLKQIGIETGGDLADSAIAIGAAVLAGREAGDIADEAQGEIRFQNALKDITKIVKDSIVDTSVVS